MKAFAEQAAVAVEHARLVEQLETRGEQLEEAKREIAALLEVRTQELETTRASLARAQQALDSRSGIKGLVGQSAAMRKVVAVVERVRDTDVPVVIEGESGQIDYRAGDSRRKYSRARAVRRGALRSDP